jgi:hypothetical protein
MPATPGADLPLSCRRGGGDLIVPELALPAWVTLPDGRRVPFDVDAISTALFAATEARGQPDAFLARELADAVLYFLAQDAADTAPSTSGIAELIVKVVRELGQPELARAYAERQQAHRVAVAPAERMQSPEQAVEACLADYALTSVFSADLAAAHRAGLIEIDGLSAPALLQDTLVEVPGGGWHERCVALRDAIGCAQRLVVDGPEWLIDGQVSAAGLTSMLQLGRLVRRKVVYNVNCRVPPGWVGSSAPGPLFAGTPGPVRPAQAGEFLRDLLAQWPDAADDACQLEFHLGAADLETTSPLLERAVELSTRSSSIAFVFDRPRQSVVLAEGVDRQHPAVLQQVRLALDSFLSRPDIAGDRARFVQRLPSLASMAVSAGAQKRSFLRRHSAGGAAGRGFLLERARLVVMPSGLDKVVRRLAGEHAPALECAMLVVEALASGLARAGRRANLETRLDIEALALPAPSLAKELQAAAKLRACAGPGTVRIDLSGRAPLSAGQVLELLRDAWRRTEVSRLCFVRRPCGTVNDG